MFADQRKAWGRSASRTARAAVMLGDLEFAGEERTPPTFE